MDARTCAFGQSASAVRSFASAAASAAVLALNTSVLDLRAFARSIYALDLMLSAGLLAGLRLGLRMISERRGFKLRSGKRLLIVGGGCQAGQVIGKTDRQAGAPTERPIHFKDVFATLYHKLGIDASKTTIDDTNGRPQHLLDIGDPIRELV